MLNNPQVVVANQQSGQTSLLLHKPFIHGNSSVQSPISLSSNLLAPSKNYSTNYKNLRVAFPGRNTIKASLLDRLRSRDKQAAKKATLSVVVQRETAPKVLSEKAQSLRDRADDFLGIANFSVELISAEIDLETGKQRTKKCFPESKTARPQGKVMNYEAKVDVPEDFGEVGAVRIENDFEREIFIKNISLNFDDKSSVYFSCESWVQSKRDVPKEQQLRLFFSDKSYLPSKTPSGLKDLRKQELKTLRGEGTGERKEYERVYDYDVYNDLGDPDKSPDLQRPVLGGPQHPYPRRGRTGRGPAKTDESSESRGDENESFYVPRDETFAEVKQNDFGTRRMELALKNIVPFLENNMFDEKFPNFTDIDKMFKEGYVITDKSQSGSGASSIKEKIILNVGTKLYSSVLAVDSLVDNVIKFKQPPTADMDKFFWFRDDEFARQTLAGLNPCCLQLVEKWPLKSDLDPSLYGPQESKITTEIVEQQLKAYDYTLAEARREKKLYLLDYHDVLLPYVSKVRKLEGRTLYGSRSLFFLTPYGTLMPVAIELTRPKMDGVPQWKEVYTPNANWHSTDVWLWKLAKAHVLAHDAGVHQLVSHWLRTHCAVEPYVIATNRQLSAMHPINRLLQPHLRYTMEINALARKTLINAGGVIESTFAPGKYCIELSSVIYKEQWRFNLQALPADLVRRGMAVKDESYPHGLKLTIEDYPYANDGLLIWDAIKEWVTEYVNHYYASSSEVETDHELQDWWNEIKTVGHGDIKDGWPELKTPEDLIEIVTSIAWIASGHHAAVNFGQYAFSAYFPNRPSLTRTTMPSEDKESRPEVWKAFKANPEDTILQCFPSQIQAAKNMATLDLLSTHASDEEYLGHHIESAWREDPYIYKAFQKFQEKIKKIEDIIDERNDDENLKNRHGAGVLPYEFLKPFSEEGVTNKGVPYSISI